MIYLIHLEIKFKHAQHYLGFVEKEENLISRLKYHMKGHGSKFLKAVNDNKISYKVVRLLEGDRNRERKIKNGHKTSDYCPICRKRCSYEEAIDVGSLLQLYYQYGDTIRQFKKPKNGR